MKARVVIGANFGDEGKGLVTDYLCAQGAEMVVRFNGGAQAGHTVVTPDGNRHIFHHFGSGSLLGIPTYLSQFFIVNPICFYRELEELKFLLDSPPTVYAHPECIVTTFADMIINQEKEDQRGDQRHGSVGLGINETVNRSLIKDLKITMGDLWNGKNLESVIGEICDKYAKFRIKKPIEKPENMIKAFLEACEHLANDIHPLGIQQCKDPVFEGAQGLLLDQDNKEFYPHVTRSKTGIHNVRILCSQAKITDIQTYYVSRTYLTKHGAGHLPGHDPNLTYFDDTNVEHSYQGSIRFAPLDYSSLIKRCEEDHGDRHYKLALTHIDQFALKERAELYSYGPTRNDICLTPKMRVAI